MRKIFILIISLLSSGFTLESQDSSRLFYDLERLEKVDKKLNDKLPLLYNYNLQGGYFVMPSARMGYSGNTVGGYSYVPPYSIYTVAFQYFDHLELSGNYWVFNHQLEGTFGRKGFGNDADRVANAKISFLRKEDGLPYLPEFAIGFNDFIGSQRFHSQYLVATKDFLDQNLEITLGVGRGRIHKIFGGFGWTPFRKWDNFLNSFTLAGEYDANNYNRKEEHRKGRTVKYPINLGMHFNWEGLHLAFSSIRGEKIAASGALNYNFGTTKGFLPKTQDPLPYTSPIDLEALGENRKEEAFAQELAYAFQKERIDLYTIFLYFDKDKRKCLWLKIINDSYRSEQILRNHLQKLLSNLTPENVYQIVISVESEGILSHSYVFKLKDLGKYEKKEISSKELEVLSPMLEPIFPPGEFESKLLYIRHKKICLFNLKPSLHTYFGSTKGKLKYDVGFLFGPEGYLFDSIYYELKASYIVKSTNRDVGDKDINNPSQLLNVRTDSINYWQTNTLHVERGYLQKTFNLDKSWFLRGSMGYFEIAYGGVAMEALYYPVNSLWAIGVEGSTLLKRKYSGLSFQSKVRKWEGDTPVFEHYVGLQYFLDFYFDVPIVKLNFKTSVGQFLAKDKGVRFDMMRYFKSGLRVGFWYTFTSGHDKVNGKTYFDKGFSISMPLDFFMAKSSRTRMFYEMSAWLRDVGAKAYTGKEIYPILHEERLE